MTLRGDIVIVEFPFQDGTRGRNRPPPRRYHRLNGEMEFTSKPRSHFRKDVHSK
jgi:hypothetical protein